MEIDPLERIAELRREVDRARADQARAQAQADQADSVVKEAFAQIREMGCMTLEEALEEIKKLRVQLTSQIGEIETSLGEIE